MRFSMVFPARAGMSPHNAHDSTDYQGVPRASGDEPSRRAVGHFPAECSPRERG